MTGFTFSIYWWAHNRIYRGFTFGFTFTVRMNWGFTEDLPDLLSGFTEDLPGIYRFGRFTVRIYPNYHIMAIIMHLQVAALIMVAIITQFETVASPHRVQSSNDGAAPPKYSRNAFFDKPSLKSFFTRSWGHAFVPFRPLLRIVVSGKLLGHPQQKKFKRWCGTTQVQ